MRPARIIPTGTAYGVALNDRELVAAMAADFTGAPYNAAPKAPVLYIKPRSCFTVGGAPIPLPENLPEVCAAATIGLLFARDLSKASPDEVRGAVGGVCLALDVYGPLQDFYRPAIKAQGRDGFLPLGDFAPLPATLGDIITEIEGAEAHRWPLDRLVRSAEALAAEISAFMTLQAGDLLLVGTAGDAPHVREGQSITVKSAALPTLRTHVEAEAHL